MDSKKDIEKLEKQVNTLSKWITQIRPFFYFLALFTLVIFIFENIQNIAYLEESLSLVSIVGLSLLVGFIFFFV